MNKNITEKERKEGRLLERTKCRQEGEQKERIKIAKKLLHQNMDIVFIFFCNRFVQKKLNF